MLTGTECNNQNLESLDDILNSALSISYIRDDEQPFSFDETYLGRCGNSLYLIDHKKRKITYMIFRNGSLDLLKEKLNVLSYTSLYSVDTLQLENDEITDFRAIKRILESQEILINNVPENVVETYQQYLNMTHDECLEYLRSGKQKVFQYTQLSSSWDNIILSAEILDIKFGFKLCERHHTIGIFQIFKKRKLFETCSMCSLLNKRSLPMVDYLQNESLQVPESFTIEEWRLIWNYFDYVIHETPHCIHVLACILQRHSLQN
jgi:hypothetical protein